MNKSYNINVTRPGRTDHMGTSCTYEGVGGWEMGGGGDGGEEGMGGGFRYSVDIFGLAMCQ